jgi:hypothetical protein
VAHFADLEQLIGPAEHAAAPPDWVEVEERLGLRLPVDYKRMFGSYCYLKFDDYLMVYRPGPDGESLHRGAINSLDAVRTLALEFGRIRVVDERQGNAREERPLPFYPESGGLFPWAVTEGGEHCMWLTSPNSPEHWPVVVSDGSLWWEYSGSWVDFLIGVMDSSVQCPIFPESFPQSNWIDQFAVDEFDGNR